ncbi:MAG: NUDIX domain-containing protein [Deltaproteobacteria bacterium]|nr:NUDIX domain-containing protein [Deltaproteobacteria bacterium]
MESQRLQKTLVFLLRHRPDVGRLRLDREGWADMARVAAAVARLTRRAATREDVLQAVEEDAGRTFEVLGNHIRIRRPRRGRRGLLPDILYLPVVAEDLPLLAEREVLERPDGSSIRLFDREQRAWLAAHRQPEGEPALLYVDSIRAARAGTSFTHLGGGLWATQCLPARHVLNLHPKFGVQASAGGFLIRRGKRGGQEVALVRVRRRARITWEVAKGKMELGETPVDTAIREIREEMGLDVPIEVISDLGPSHYGFSTPSGEPRLKVLHLFVLRALQPIEVFRPLGREGIEEIAFFDPDAAVREVTHGSLMEPIRRLRRWLAEHPEAPEEVETPWQATTCGVEGGLLDDLKPDESRAWEDVEVRGEEDGGGEE